MNQKVFFGPLSTHGVLFLMHLIIFKQGRSCVLGVYIQDLRPSRDCICFWKSPEGTSNSKRVVGGEEGGRSRKEPDIGFGHKRSHFRPKPFGDPRLATMLTREQATIIKI